MANLGFLEYIKSLSIDCHLTKVGDKNVSKGMRQNNTNIGGESSGHIILSDFSTTGDGIVAALQILAIMVEDNVSSSSLFNLFNLTPQILHNVRFNNSFSPLSNQKVINAISEIENQVGSEGRVLVRKSGTEPVIRIMIEGHDVDLNQKSAHYIENVINDVSVSA